MKVASSGWPSTTCSEPSKSKGRQSRFSSWAGALRRWPMLSSRPVFPRSARTCKPPISGSCASQAPGRSCPSTSTPILALGSLRSGRRCLRKPCKCKSRMRTLVFPKASTLSTLSSKIPIEEGVRRTSSAVHSCFRGLSCRGHPARRKRRRKMSIAPSTGLGRVQDLSLPWRLAAAQSSWRALFSSGACRTSDSFPSPRRTRM
mmetsp:Transcript_10678/g.24904  ORF Transcript_10678/g.24904 Transcript_10678/m.24904 type:complete len:203 (+) Transcript_10678:279-887(+)